MRFDASSRHDLLLTRESEEVLLRSRSQLEATLSAALLPYFASIAATSLLIDWQLLGRG